MLESFCDLGDYIAQSGVLSLNFDLPGRIVDQRVVQWLHNIESRAAIGKVVVEDSTFFMAVLQSQFEPHLQFKLISLLKQCCIEQLI